MKLDLIDEPRSPSRSLSQTVQCGATILKTDQSGPIGSCPRPFPLLAGRMRCRETSSVSGYLAYPANHLSTTISRFARFARESVDRFKIRRYLLLPSLFVRNNLSSADVNRESR